MGYPDGEDFEQLPPLPEPEMVLETFSSRDYDFSVLSPPESTPDNDE